MSTLIFNANDVKRCIEHIRASKEFRPAVIDFDEVKGECVYGSPFTPSLLLVHDDGVYLMSGGIPRDLVDPNKPDGSSFCAYARGCNPDCDPDWWDASVSAVGGDDFGEYLGAEFIDEMQRQIESGTDTIRINVTDGRVALLAGRPDDTNDKHRRTPARLGM